MNKPHLSALLASSAVATVLLSPVTATAAADTFLKIDGVQGESLDKAHKGDIEMLSWTWGESKSITQAANTGASGGKSVSCISDMTITKNIDSATPHLLTSTIRNESFPHAKLTVRSASDSPNPLEYFTVTMANVIITSYSVSGSDGGGKPAENITLHFNSADGQYVQQSPSGAPMPPVTWTVSENGGRGNPLCP